MRKRRKQKKKSSLLIQLWVSLDQRLPTVAYQVQDFIHRMLEALSSWFILSPIYGTHVASIEVYLNESFFITGKLRNNIQGGLILVMLFKF